MPAIVNKAFKAVRPGDVYPSQIEPGEEVEGRLEEIARQLGALEGVEPEKPGDAGPAPETAAASVPEVATPEAVETAAAPAAPETAAAEAPGEPVDAAPEAPAKPAKRGKGA